MFLPLFTTPIPLQSSIFWQMLHCLRYENQDSYLPSILNQRNTFFFFFLNSYEVNMIYFENELIFPAVGIVLLSI